MLTEEKLLDFLSRLWSGELDKEYSVNFYRRLSSRAFTITLCNKNKYVKEKIINNEIIKEEDPNDISLTLDFEEINDGINKIYIAKIISTNDKIHISENCFMSYEKYIIDLENKRTFEYRTKVKEIFNI